ncbi:MAG: outer membrane lipoprotein carrier protein LolA [Bacteroidota bacterium]
MIKKTFTVIALMLFFLCLQAQDSEKAKALLDEVYTKVASYNNIAIDFKYTLENTEANTKSETRGNVTLKGDKYRANFFGATQIYDGNKLYTIIPDNEEVTIDDKSEDEETITPSKMLTFYRKGHNYTWDILQNVQGRKVQYVKLTPIDSNSDITSSLWMWLVSGSKKTKNLRYINGY